jgi:hypothetical protein
MASSPVDSMSGVVSGEDPRVSEQFLSIVPGEEQTHETIIVGTVHDHPASAYRTRTVVSHVDPDFVAIEIPPVAVPLFEKTAESDHPPLPVGGSEMSAALAGNTGGNAVGLDSFGTSFFGHFLSEAYRTDTVSPADTWRALGAVRRVQKEAVLCRASAKTGRLRGWIENALVSFEYDVTADDPPLDQARDEQEHVSKNRSLLEAVDRPASEELLDSARERNMSAQLSSLRRAGTVVAVVGFDHHEPITKRLDGD